MRKHIKNNVSWVGYIDWELTSFHGDDYSVNNGSSQNAYLIVSRKLTEIERDGTIERLGYKRIRMLHPERVKQI